MNLLGLVFSVLLMLSISTYLSFDKQVINSRLRSTYVAHLKSNRNILNSYQSAVYKNIKGKTTQASSHRSSSEEGEDLSAEDSPLFPNRECARLNLWPLVQEGKDSHPFLYERIAHLIREFYGPLSSEKRFEYHMLDLLISQIQEKPLSALEKLPLKNPAMQTIYYRMLKGTKTWDLSTHTGIPPLLDYLKIEPAIDPKVCLYHAHLDMLTLLFNPQMAQKLHKEIHKKDRPQLTKEYVERLCNETRTFKLDEALLTLLEFGYPYHNENKKIFAASEANGVSLRKNLFLKPLKE